MTLRKKENFPEMVFTKIQVLHILVGNPGKGRKKHGVCQSVHDRKK